MVSLFFASIINIYYNCYCCSIIPIDHVGITDGPESAMLQMRVAKMVTCAPSGMVKEEYLQRLSSQVIELLHFALEIDDKVEEPDATVAIACPCIDCMSHQLM